MFINKCILICSVTYSLYLEFTNVGRGYFQDANESAALFDENNIKPWNKSGEKYYSILRIVWARVTARFKPIVEFILMLLLMGLNKTIESLGIIQNCTK